MSSLSTAYLIHGEEELLRLEALDQIRHTARTQGYTDRKVMTIDAGFDWSLIWSEIQSVGLFADKKFLELHVLSGKPGKEGSAVLLQLIDQLAADTCIVLVLPKLDRAQMQSKWFTAWSKKATVIEAKSIGASLLPQWIKNRLAQHDLSIEPDALALFAEKVEGNLLAARQEIDKLALLYPEAQTIGLQAIENAIADVARFDVFQLASAWMSGDAARLLRLLDGLSIHEGEPVLLLWAVSEDIRILLKVLAALKQGQPIAELRRSLRLWGDKQTLAPLAAKRIGPARLLAALQSCAQIDRQIKGVHSGNAWSQTKQLLLSLTY
ncbi:DNA polymerase III subunit delta [Neisseriaceae bacterium ESL0693]|nr:DNA polymerase III subunit delta [Neisseriaceae bacterium ESL0693]